MFQTIYSNFFFLYKSNLEFWPTPGKSTSCHCLSRELIYQVVSLDHYTQLTREGVSVEGLPPARFPRQTSLKRSGGEVPSEQVWTCLGVPSGQVWTGPCVVWSHEDFPVDRQTKRMTDRQTWLKHCLLATPLAGGKNGIFVDYQYIHQELVETGKNHLHYYTGSLCVAGIKGGVLFPIKLDVFHYVVGLQSTT